MTTTLTQVSTYLNDIGVNIEEVREDLDEIMFFLNPLNVALRCFINVKNKGRLLMVAAYPQGDRHQALDAVRREQVLDVMNEFNKDFGYGRWSLDEDNDTRVTFQIFLEDAELTRRQLGRVIFILNDLVIQQSQVLQLLIRTGIQMNYADITFSGLTIKAAIAYPDRVTEIADALHLRNGHSEYLHKLMDVPYSRPEEYPAEAEAEDSTDESDIPKFLLN